MPHRVLVVDDEEELASSLSEIFVSNGYVSSFATDPLAVKALVTTRKPDLIVMDIKMPKLGGIELLKCLKKEKRSIPVIMITGYPSIENAVQAMKYGALNIGAIFMGVLANGIVLLDISAYWERVIIGAVVVAAVIIDILRKR
jgi:DNA-binding NtrC family response regulator